MGILDRVKTKRAEQKAEGERKQAVREEERVREAAEAQLRAQIAAEQEREAQEAAQRQRVVEILGADLAEMEVNTPEEAKIAIKMARLRKKEIQAEKRDLAAELADVREQWRDRQAGRISTVGLGRGTGGRMVRMGVQAKRRERAHGACRGSKRVVRPASGAGLPDHGHRPLRGGP